MTSMYDLNDQQNKLSSKHSKIRYEIKQRHLFIERLNPNQYQVINLPSSDIIESPAYYVVEDEDFKNKLNKILYEQLTKEIHEYLPQYISVLKELKELEQEIKDVGLYGFVPFGGSSVISYSPGDKIIEDNYLSKGEISND